MTQRNAGIGRDQLKHLTDRPYPRPLIKTVNNADYLHTLQSFP